MLLEVRAVLIRRRPGAKNAERNLGGRKVWLRLLDNAAQRFESLPMPVDHGADAEIERHAAEVFEPGDADAFKTSVEREGETFARLVDGEWRARIVARDSAQAQREIGNRSPQA